MTLPSLRLPRRLTYCLVSLMLAVSLARAGQPATTTIADVVYRGDGTPASGTLVITWPAFVSADNYSVAAGAMSFTIPPTGALNLALVPNLGGNPGGTYYKVVYQLADGTTSTEYWSVGATSPTTIAAVRTQVVPAGLAGQFATKSYVDSQVATRAADSSVVHISGAETVTGLKTFGQSPSVPTPANPFDAATKGYIDALSRAGTGTCNVSQWVYSVNNQIPPTCRTIGAQQFADQYALIQQAVTAAGTIGSVVIPADYTATDSYTNPNNINIVDLRGKPDRYKGFVNVVSDCGAKGDGVTNDGPAIQTCLNNNPGRTIFFPKMCGSQTGGGALSCVDYVSQQAITLSGNGQWLDGEGPDTWQGAPVIEFISTTAGGLAIPQNGYGEKISNLELLGPNWATNTQCTQGTNGQYWNQSYTYDGINIQGGEPTVENVVVQGFGRHGINIDGSLGGQPDLFRLVFVQASENNGDGLYIHGGDSNAGVDDHFNATSNCGWGIRDDSILGNTHIQPHSNANHREAFSAGSTVSISSISRSANVVSVTTSSNHGLVVGDWAILSGVTDTSYNGTFQVVSVGSSTTLTFNQVGANSSSSSGTVGSDGAAHIHSSASRTFQKCSISSGANVLACADGDFDDANGVGATISVAGAGAAGAILATTIAGTQNGGTGNATLVANASTTVTNVAATVGGGWSGGPYNGNQQSVTSTWINPYQESNQTKSKMMAGDVVIGGNFSSNFSLSYGVPFLLAAGTTSLFGMSNPEFVLNKDQSQFLELEGGATADQDTGIQIADHTGAIKWEIYRPSGGYIGIRDISTGVFPFDAFPNAQTDLTAQGTGTLNLQENSTGNIQLYGPLGASHSWFTSSGNLVQGNVSAPALTVNTSGADYAVLYNGNASNQLSIGFTATATANPASAVFTVPLTGNPILANSTAHALLAGEASSSVTSLGTGTAGQVLITNGSSADPSYIDFPDKKYIPAANCNNVTAAAGWSLPTSSAPTAACRTGTNVQDGVLQFADGQSAQFSLIIPDDWDSSASLDAIVFVSSSDTTSGHTIILQAATSCSKPDGSTTDDVAFNTAQSFGTVTLNTTANQSWNAALTGLTKTGCVAGGLLRVKISRTTDTATNVNVSGVMLTLRRTI